MAFTTYGSNAIIDGTPLPSTLYVSVHTGAPGASALDNASLVNLARQAVTLSAGAAGVGSNEALITLASDGVGTETIRGIALWDALTAGNPWLVGDVSPAVTMTAGETVTFPIGALVARIV